MGDVVNLRAARKRKARAEKDLKAAENRAVHGQSRAESKLARSLREATAARHEAHLREVRTPVEDK